MQSMVGNSDSRAGGETLQVRVGWSLLSWTKGGWSGSVGGNPLVVWWLGLHTSMLRTGLLAWGRHGAWDFSLPAAILPRSLSHLSVLPFIFFLRFIFKSF